MADEAPHIDHAILGYQYTAFEWSMVAFTFLLLVNRLYFRVYLHGNIFSVRAWRLSEYLIILAWLLYMATAITDSLLNDMGNWDPNWVPTDADFPRMAKLFFVQSYMNFPSIYCAKGALVCFYYELTPAYSYRNLRWAIKAVGVLVVIGAVEQIIHQTLDCYPHVGYAWNGTVKTYDELVAMDEWCRPKDEIQFLVMYALHIATDVFIFILPFFIVGFALAGRPLSTKLATYAMFGVGLMNLTCALTTFGLIRVLYLQPYLATKTYWTYWQAQNMVGMVQSATAVMIPCLPQLRLLYKKFRAPKTVTSTSDSDATRVSAKADPEMGWLSKFTGRPRSKSAHSSASQLRSGHGDEGKLQGDVAAIEKRHSEDHKE